MSQKKGIDWDEQPLGKVSDASLAKTMGVSTQTVGAARRYRNIKPFVKCSRKGIDWDAQPLGEISDSSLATKLGVGQSIVSGARRRRFIKGKFPGNKKIDWSTMPLGKVSDASLAKDVGVHHSIVTRARKIRGIPPLNPISRRKNIDWDSVGLGSTTDVQIAIKVGTTPTAVSTARRRRGISSYAIKCSVCGSWIKTCGGNTSIAPACSMCRDYASHAKEETSDKKLIILLAKTSLLANLTEEKILKHKEKQNEKRD